METYKTLITLAICGLVVCSLAAPVEDEQAVGNETRIVFGAETMQRVTTHIIYHIEPDLFLEPGSFLFSWGSGIKTTRYAWQIYPVTGSIDSSGYREGEAQGARFSEITSFLQLSKYTVVIVDQRNGCVRILDRKQNRTSSFVGRCTASGFADGKGDRAQFNWPSDVLLDECDNKNLLILDDLNNAIRFINVATKEVSTVMKGDASTMERPTFATFDAKDKNILYFSTMYQIMKLSLSDQKLTELVGVKQPGGPGPFADGSFSDARLGYLPAQMIRIDDNHLAVADFWKHEVRLLDLQNNQLTSICQPRLNDSLISGVGCSLTNPHALLLHNGTLFVGDSGSIHMIQVSSLDVATFASRKCSPRNIDATIAVGEDKAKVEIEEDKVLLLSAGNHKYVYMNDGRECTVFIAVTVGKDVCPAAINKVASPATQTATIDLNIGTTSLQFVLRVGNHVYKIAIGDVNCSVNINVFDGNLEKRLEFVADYQYSCAGLSNDVTKNLIKSMAENNFIYILELCNGVCTKETGSKPVVMCDKDRLSVVYSTNLVYGGDVLSIPQDIKDQLTARLISKGTMMSIADISASPPVIFPIKSADGASARMRLSTYCLNKTTYDSATDTCL